MYAFSTKNSDISYRAGNLTSRVLVDFNFDPSPLFTSSETLGKRTALDGSTGAVAYSNIAIRDCFGPNFAKAFASCIEFLRRYAKHAVLTLSTLKL